MFLALLLGATFASLAAMTARARGRNSLGWFVAGLLVGPFALLVALLPMGVRDGLTARCPHCAEVVQAAAVICPHCGRALPAP